MDWIQIWASKTNRIGIVGDFNLHNIIGTVIVPRTWMGWNLSDVFRKFPEAICRGPYKRKGIET